MKVELFGSLLDGLKVCLGFRDGFLGAVLYA